MERRGIVDVDTTIRGLVPQGALEVLYDLLAIPIADLGRHKAILIVRGSVGPRWMCQMIERKHEASNSSNAHCTLQNQVTKARFLGDVSSQRRYIVGRAS